MGWKGLSVSLTPKAWLSHIETGFVFEGKVDFINIFSWANWINDDNKYLHLLPNYYWFQLLGSDCLTKKKKPTLSVPLLVRATFDGRRHRSFSHRRSTFHFPFALSLFSPGFCSLFNTLFPTCQCACLLIVHGGTCRRVMYLSPLFLSDRYFSTL